MIRPVTLTSFALALILGFALFKVKYEVQSIEDKMVRVERQMTLDEQAIHVFKASWSMETRPQALAMLASRHLDLKPMTSAEIGSYETLPLNEAGARPNAGGNTNSNDAPVPDQVAEAQTPAEIVPAKSASPVHLASFHPATPHGGVQVASLPDRIDSSGDASIDAVLQAMQSNAR